MSSRPDGVVIVDMSRHAGSRQADLGGGTPGTHVGGSWRMTFLLWWFVVALDPGLRLIGLESGC